MKKILVILLLAFMLVSCNQYKKVDTNKEKENKKTEDILKTKLEEDINPNLESEVTVE